MSLRLPVRNRVLLGVAMAACFMVPTSGARAQSIFTDLFGFTLQTSKPRRNAYIVPYNSGSSRLRGFAGRYRTICVRTCDGYYFPISQATRRSNFYDEAKQCQARCPGQARLFYAPSSASDIKWATDVSGLTYKDLKTAFLYRKKLVKGCSCRPAPWAPEERARHKLYETEAAEIATLSEGNAAIDSMGSAVRELPAGDAPPLSANDSDEQGANGAGDVEMWKLRQRRRPAPKSLSELNKNPSPLRYDPLQNSVRADGPQYLWAGDGH